MYLGKLEANTIKQAEMKEKIKKSISGYCGTDKCIDLTNIYMSMMDRGIDKWHGHVSKF